MSTPYPAQTSGIGIAAKISVDASIVSLSLGGTATHQITAHAQDVAGTNQSATLSYVSSKPSVATVSGTGLITAVAKGHAVIEVAGAVFGNTHGSRNGVALEKVYSEINVFVKA